MRDISLRERWGGEERQRVARRSPVPSPSPATMRFSLLLATLAVAVAGCDSVGIDAPRPCTTCSPDTGGSHPGGGSTGGSGATDGTTSGSGSTDGSGASDGAGSGAGDGSGDGGTAGGGSSDLTFIAVDPRQTYTRTSQDKALDAPAIRLADYGVSPGDAVCGAIAGDFYTEPGVLASVRDLPRLTAVFSADDRLLDASERHRVPGVVDVPTYVVTMATNYDQLETDIDQDFDVAEGCITVPAGAQFVFFGAYDSYYADNSDALIDGQPFGVVFKR